MSQILLTEAGQGDLEDLKMQLELQLLQQQTDETDQSQVNEIAAGESTGFSGHDVLSREADKNEESYSPRSVKMHKALKRLTSARDLFGLPKTYLQKKRDAILLSAVFHGAVHGRPAQLRQGLSQSFNRVGQQLLQARGRLKVKVSQKMAHILPQELLSVLAAVLQAIEKPTVAAISAGLRKGDQRALSRIKQGPGFVPLADQGNRNS